MVQAEFRSTTELSCFTPANTMGGVKVEVTFNKQQYTEDGLLFRYVRSRLTRIRPLTGPVQGGTPVFIHGDQFSAPSHGNITCLFGDVSVPAFVESEQVIQCTTPEWAENRQVEIQVRSMGAMYEGVVPFLFIAEAKVAAVHPVAGARYGDTHVTIFGTGFIEAALARCRFADVSVVARLLAPSWPTDSWSTLHFIGVSVVSLCCF